MKRHRTDGVSLAFGVIFLAIAAWWGLAQVFNLAILPVGWIAAATLILLGLFGLVGALRADRSPQPTDPAAPASGNRDPGPSGPTPGGPDQPTTKIPPVTQ